MNKILTLIILVAALALVQPRPTEREHKIRGGVRQLEADELNEAKEKLVLYLSKLDESDDGPHYKVDQVNSATKQLVSGHLYKIDADVIDGEDIIKNCFVKIWSQPWLENGIEVTLKCEEDEEVVKRLSP